MMCRHSTALTAYVPLAACPWLASPLTPDPRSPVLSSLVPITQIQQIVAMTNDLNHQCNEKESKISVRAALQELATMLPCTIYVHGNVKSISQRR